MRKLGGRALGGWSIAEGFRLTAELAVTAEAASLETECVSGLNL